MNINEKIQNFLNKRREMKEIAEKEKQDSTSILDIVTLSDFVGQEDAIALLEVLCQVAIETKNPLPHILVTGMPGLGKSLLASAIANETNCLFKEEMGGALTNKQSISGIVSFLMMSHPNKILFIDEIHSMKAKAAEELYKVMQDFRFGSTSIAPFCLIGASTYPGDIDDPLRTRFNITVQLQPYKPDDIKLILLGISGDKVSVDIAEYIAARSKGVVRIARNLLATTASVAGSYEKIELNHAQFVMETLGIQDNGLNRNDIMVMKALSESPKPLSIQTIKGLTGIDGSEYRELIEPVLLAMGYICILPNGRSLTYKGMQYLVSVK